VIAIVASATFWTACGTERERTAAESVAAHVHDNMRAGDFAVVYKESAPRIKTVATESEFVDYFKVQQNFGLLKTANEVAYEAKYDSRIGRMHVLVFDLEYERGRVHEILTLVRSDSGEMQLWKLAIGSDD
jgi:hypothetical protein